MLNVVAGIHGGPFVAPPLTYSETVLLDSPTAFYLMDETSGATAADTSGNGYNATIQGGVTLNVSTGLTGIPKAMTFNGSTGVIYSPNNAAFTKSPDTAWSVDWWFKTTDTNLDNLKNHFSIRDNNANDAGTLVQAFQSYNNAGYVIGSSFASGSGRVNLETTSNVSNGSWHYAALTAVSGGAFKFYIDGTEVASSSTTRRSTNSGNNYSLSIGANRVGASSWQQFFDGSLTAVAFYSTTLSGSSVSAHYSAGV